MGVGFAATGVFTVAAADLGTAWTVVAIGVSGLFTAPSASAMLLIRKQQSPPTLRSQVFTVGAGFRAAAAAAGAAVAGLAAGSAARRSSSRSASCGSSRARCSSPTRRNAPPIDGA